MAVILKTTDLLDCALIGVCAVIRLNFLSFLSPYTASRPRRHSRQVGSVVLKEEGKYRQKNKEGIVRG